MVKFFKKITIAILSVSFLFCIANVIVVGVKVGFNIQQDSETTTRRIQMDDRKKVRANYQKQANST